MMRRLRFELFTLPKTFDKQRQHIFFDVFKDFDALHIRFQNRSFWITLLSTIHNWPFYAFIKAWLLNNQFLWKTRRLFVSEWFLRAHRTFVGFASPSKTHTADCRLLSGTRFSWEIAKLCGILIQQLELTLWYANQSSSTCIDNWFRTTFKFVSEETTTTIQFTKIVICSTVILGGPSSLTRWHAFYEKFFSCILYYTVAP